MELKYWRGDEQNERNARDHTILLYIVSIVDYYETKVCDDLNWKYWGGDEQNEGNARDHTILLSIVSIIDY